jgi:hypothetical protein
MAEAGLDVRAAVLCRDALARWRVHPRIQARGGCACAGPHVHRLLGIDDAHSQTIQLGAELDKPSFARVSFSHQMVGPRTAPESRMPPTNRQSRHTRLAVASHQRHHRAAQKSPCPAVLA